MAIKIPFVADVDGFIRGTRDVEQGIEHIGDALDDVTTAGARVDTEVGSDLDSLARDADASAEKIERSFKDAFHAVEAQGRTSTTKVKHDVDDVGRSGSRTMEEFSSEAKQNVAESVSSFQGDASSAVDAIQSTFGGLVSALGPAGVVGAAVIGVGIGLARNLFEKSKEQAAEVAEGVADLAGQLIELGRSSLGADQVNEQLKTLASTAEDGKNKLQEIAATASKAGIGYRTYARGLAGDNDAIKVSYDQVTSGLDDYWAGLYKLTQQFGIGSPEVLAYANAHRDTFNALTQSQKALLAQDATLDQASRTTELYNDAVAGSVDNAEAEAEALREQNDALQTNASLKGGAVSAEIAMRDALDGVTAARKENGKSLDLNSGKGRDNTKAVLEAVDAINEWGGAQVEAGRDVATVNRGLDDQETALVQRVAKAFGITQRQARAYIRTLGGIPKQVDTDVDVDDKGTAKKTKGHIDEAAKDRDTTVTVKADMSHVDRQIKSYFNGRSYDFTAYARPGKAVAK